MKKIIFPAILAFLISACSSSTQNSSDRLLPEPDKNEHENSAAKMELEFQYYTGRWAGTKYNLIYKSGLFEETNKSDSYHDFKIKNGGSTPGFISITTVKMDSATQNAHDIVNNLHKNAKGKILGEIQTKVEPQKFGENLVYLFQDKAMSGFAQDAIIIGKAEAIHVKFQSQASVESELAKDKESFQTFLSSITISEGK